MAARVFDLPPDRAFHLVASLGEHGRWIPLTRVTAAARLPQAGDDVVARSAGVFVDRMRVVSVDPPRELVLRKLGPVLLGTSTITVVPAGAGARVSWTYEAYLRGPVPASAALSPLLEAMAGFAMWRMDRWVRRTRPTA